MFRSSKYDQKKRERYVRQLAQRLLAEAKPAHRHGWGITELLAAYRIGQVLTERIAPWWWSLEIHEIDLLFPWDEDMVNAMAEDMQRNGYGEDGLPILLFEDKVLDGKMRLEAARRAQVTPRFDFFDGEVKEALQYALRLNGRRRRFSEAERAAMLEAVGIG
jgi:hypothetical protein